jgi:hypothetical protein
MDLRVGVSRSVIYGDSYDLFLPFLRVMVAVEELVAVGEEKDGTYQSESPVSFDAALKIIEADERLLDDPEGPPRWDGRRPTRDHINPTPPGRSLR